MRRNRIVGIFLVALILRCLCVYFERNSPLTGDAAQYISLAESLRKGSFRFSPTTFENRPVAFWPPMTGPTSLRTPGYPFFLAVFANSLIAVRIAQCFLGALSVLLVYYLGSQISPKVGIIAAGIIAVYPVFITYTHRIHSETLLVFVLLLLLCSAYKASRTPTISNSIITGVIMAAAMYAKEVAVLIPLFVLPLLKRKFVVALTVFVLIIPWIARNYYVHRALVWATTAGGTFYLSNNPAARGGYGISSGLRFDEHAREVQGMSEIQINNLRFRQGLTYLKTNPSHIPKLFFRKFLMLWNVYDLNYRISYGIVLMFFIYGIFLLKHPIKYFFWTYIIYFSIIAIIFHGKPRFRMPFEPNLILFAAVAINHIWNNRQKLRYRIGFYSIVLVNLLCGIFSKELLSIFRSIFQVSGLR